MLNRNLASALIALNRLAEAKDVCIQAAARYVQKRITL